MGDNTAKSKEREPHAEGWRLVGQQAPELNVPVMAFKTLAPSRRNYWFEAGPYPGSLPRERERQLQVLDVRSLLELAPLLLRTPEGAR